jgi:hypothetical protein
MERELLEEMVVQQRQKLFLFAKRIVSCITPDDLLQPQDFPELEMHPEFRYEEGVLAGMQAALAAIYQLR